MSAEDESPGQTAAAAGGATSTTNTNTSPETTPEQWDRIKSFLRSLPSSDTISRSTNSLEKEANIVREFLSQQVPLPQLFLSLDQATRAGQRDRVSQAANAISRIFGSQIGPTVLDDPIVLPNLNGGMQHPDEEVRKLTGKVLYKALCTQPHPPPGFVRLLLSSEVASSLVHGVADKSIAVGQHAADALIEALRQAPYDESSPQEAAASTSDMVTSLVQLITNTARSEPIAHNSVLQLRYADLIARALAVSEKVLRAAITTGAIEILFALVEGDDVLVQFSALELLEGIAQTRHGVHYLFQRGTVTVLLGHATGKGKGGEPDPILGGTALRILGIIYKTVLTEGGGIEGLDEAKVMSVLSTVIQYAESGREENRLSALQVICAFASASPSALRLLLEDPVLLSTWLDVRSAKTEMKAASLHSLAKALRGEDPSASSTSVGLYTTITAPSTRATPEETAGGGGGGEVTSLQREMSDLHRLLFSRVGELNGSGITMNWIQAQLKVPIPSIRHALYDVLCAIVPQPGGWGMRALFGTGGFREFLENRQTEISKEGKEWKYSLIQAVVNNPESRTVLNEDLLGSLREYLNLGPFYVGRQAEVEMMM